MVRFGLPALMCRPKSSMQASARGCRLDSKRRYPATSPEPNDVRTTPPPPRPPTLASSHRVVEAQVHLFEQQPRAPIAHPHLARGLRQGSGARNAFEKFDLADSDGTPAAEIDAKSHGEGFLPSELAHRRRSDRQSDAVGGRAAQLHHERLRSRKFELDDLMRRAAALLTLEIRCRHQRSVPTPHRSKREYRPQRGSCPARGFSTSRYPRRRPSVGIFLAGGVTNATWSCESAGADTSDSARRPARTSGPCRPPTPPRSRQTAPAPCSRPT